MNYEQFTLINPITLDSISKLFDELEKCKTDRVIINTGMHEFDNIKVLKSFKYRFTAEAETTSKFKKIAFIHPEGYFNFSENMDRYNFFTNKSAAVHWLIK